MCPLTENTNSPRLKKKEEQLVAQAGVNYIRIRVWNDPYDEDGNGYGGGNNDVATAVELGKRATKYGMKVSIDFHYSDFWADPGKQIKPKAWEGYTVEELEQAVYDFMVDTMKVFCDHGINTTMVQVGNELSNGLLWPEGKVPNYDNIARFVNAGIRGVRAVTPDVPVMIHLDNGGNNALYREWFDEFTKRGEDFLNRISHIEGNKGRGFFYWEPAWIPVPGSGWATEASLKYMNDKGPCGNEWANQALFDYDGNALPAWNLIRDFKPQD